jgi:hypothetical protein
LLYLVGGDPLARSFHDHCIRWHLAPLYECRFTNREIDTTQRSIFFLKSLPGMSRILLLLRLPCESAATKEGREKKT